MKKCWNQDSLKRPHASEVKKIFDDWCESISNRIIFNGNISNNIIEFYKADKVLKEKQTNISYIHKSHLHAYHTSHLLDFTKQLNEILNQEKHVETKSMFYFLYYFLLFGLLIIFDVLKIF